MKRRIFATHLVIRNTLFVLLVVTVALFIFLKNGISIKHLKIGSFTIERLYLKLNKKLVLRADKLIIPTKKKKEAFPNPEKDLDRINEILRYFETIELKEIVFKNNHYSVLYADQIFYMVSDLFEIATHQISREGDELHAVIDLFYLKQYDIRLAGKLVYNYKRDTGLLRGHAEYEDIYADFMINKQKKNIYYTMQSKKFSQLKSFIEQLKLPLKISQWITDKVKAKFYRLESLKGAAKVGRSGIRLVPESMSAEAVLEDVLISFQEGISPIGAEKTKIVLDQGNLYFTLTKPHLDERSLLGSSASILNLMNKKSAILHLDLEFTTALDDKVQKILHAYEIKVPLMQMSGTTKTILRIDLDLRSKKLDYFCDLRLNKGEMAIGNVTFSILKGTIEIEKGVATLSGFELQNKMYRSGLEGEVDFEKKTADFNLDIYYLYLGTKEEHVLSMKNEKVPLNINYVTNILIELPTLKTKVKLSSKDGSKMIEMSDLSVLKKSLKDLPITINGGQLKIRTQNDKTYQFDGLLTRNDCFLYENESLCLTQIPITGFFSDKTFILKAFQNRFVFNANQSLITLKNLNFDLKKFFETHENDNKTGIEKKIKVIGTDSILRYDKSKLLTDKYTLGILPGGNFHFRGTLGEDAVTVTKSKKNMEIKANRIGDKMLHPLINFSGLQKGRYSVEMTGEMGKLIKGVIKLDGGVMSDFKAYNNTLAFINTVPALATLNSPGFSSKGFKINRGMIKFTIVNGRTLTFDSILIEGKSATISGDGVIDLETKKIDVDLAIQAAKSVGKLVGSLPVVGYILTGENKSIMTVGLHIDGTLEKPVTKTSTIKDILLLPFNMLKRTFQGPEK